MQDVGCDPSGRLFACGTLKGEVCVYSHGDTDGRVISLDTECGVVRAIGFSGDNVLCAGTASGDLCLLDVGEGTCVRRLRHDRGEDVVGMHRLLSVEDGSFVCSGDDEGGVALWDVRESKDGPVHLIEPHSDYVSDMVYVPHKNALLTVSGDGTLCMTDVRMDTSRIKLKHRSEDDADDELLSVCVVRQGQKVVCGTTSGVLNIYSWGYWNDCSDRFPGHPESVTGIVAFDEETVLTGSSDGLIRVLNIQPNKMLGVLGEHSDFDMERLALTRDKKSLASISHDHTLKLWNSGLLLEEEDEEDSKKEEAGSDEKEEDKNEGDVDGKGDDEQEHDDDDDTSDDDDGGGKRKRKDKKNSRGKGAHKIPKKRPENDNFFADLL